MRNKYLRVLSKLIAIIIFITSIFVVCIAVADPCDPLFDGYGVQLFKADSSPVCESDTTAGPYAEDCVQVFDVNDEPLLQYAQGDSSFHPAKIYYCPSPPPESFSYSGPLQFFSDLDKNPLNLPVAGLPFNIPVPGYVIPGGGLCGNGYLDPGEECDFGPPETENQHAYNIETGQLHQDENGQPIVIIGNDDDTPNWCRSDCTLPVLGDQVIDFAYAEIDDGSGNESSVATTQEWIDLATQFREDPQAYSEQFIEINEEVENPGPGGIPDPTPPTNGQTLVCDLKDHMCRPANEADQPSTVSCAKHEDCGHFACSGIQCKRVAGAGDTKCSEATSVKDCAHLGCEGIQCKLLPGKGPNTCDKPKDCWGTACSLRAAQCVAAPIPIADSECMFDSDCDAPADDDDSTSGTPGSNAYNGESYAAELELPMGCAPGQECVPGVCQNWCVANLNGACTGTLEDWCTHEDNQCTRGCVDLYVDYDFRTTVYEVLYKFNGFTTPFSVGEHVGGGVRIPSWVAVNRFNKEIVCDAFEVAYNDFEDSFFVKYHNHGRTLDVPNGHNLSKTKYEWFLEGPACIENNIEGYLINFWHIDGLVAPQVALPSCILDNIGNGDCDSDWEDRHLTAVTSRACTEALEKADFFCDTMCANDGYVLPYRKIKDELENHVAAALLEVPAVDTKDSYHRKGVPLWWYLARSGYITSWSGLNELYDWPLMKEKLIAKWEQYHTKEGAFTCKGAFGEDPDHHFSIHRKFVLVGTPGTWVLEGLSGMQGHNSNSDMAAQLKLAEHCMSIDAAETGVDEFTYELDWNGVHGPHTITKLCENHCGDNDARIDKKNTARKDAPITDWGLHTTFSSVPSKASEPANHWDLDSTMSSFTSMVSNSICENISSNLPFCDAKKHTRKNRGEKQIKGM